MTGLVLAHPLVRRALRHLGPPTCFTAPCSSAVRRQRSVPALLCLSSSLHVECAMHVVARACHVAAAPTVADPAKSEAEWRATDTCLAHRGATSSTSDNSGEVKPVTTATPLRTLSTITGGARAALHRLRGGRRRRHRGRSSESPLWLNAAPLPSPSTGITRQLGQAAAAAADSDVTGPTLSSPSSLMHSRRGAKTVTAPTPLEAAVYVHFRRGTWAEALALLAAAHSHSSSSDSPKQSPAAGRISDVLAAERCVSLLLWTGREAAAWQVWRWMQATGAPSPRSARQPSHAPNSANTAAAAAASSPRLVLLLVLFQHFAGQGGASTQDLLLLLEVTRRKSKAAAVVKENVRSSKGTHSPPPPSSTPHRGNDTQEAWMPLVVEWLRCLTAGETATVTAFHHAASQRVVRAVQCQRPEEAEMVALLLLGLQVYIPVARRGHHFDEVASSSSSSAIDEPDREVREEYRMCVRLWEVAAGRASGRETAAAAAAYVREQEDKAAEMTPFRKSVRAAFSAALRTLEQVQQGSFERETKRKGEPRNKRASSHPMPLAVYRFWSRRLLTVMGLPAAAWRDVPRALHIHPGHDTSGSSNAASSSSSAEWLRRVHRATDSGDWVTALRLCLADTPAQGVEARHGLPWLQRLRKGLTACEVAARKGRLGNRNSAPWQGAMALWGFADSHAGTHDDLTRERGRVLMLLASATRWAEALRCFHDTPAASLDGFMVAQVCYALRASADQRDRAVLDLWATWRCRVGDSVALTPEMVVQLLQAMLHTSAPLLPTTTGFTTASEGSQEAALYAVESPTVLAAEVATGLLVAAAAAEAAPAPTPPSGDAAASPAHVAGSEVPLDWQRHRSLVRQLLTDRWTGGWREALQVALASADVALVHHVAPRVPPTATPSPSSTLFMSVVRHLRCRGVNLTASEQAALWGQWGSEAVTRGEGRRQRRRDEGGVVVGTERKSCSASAPVVLGSREDVRQVTRDAESLLDELLQRD